MTPLRSLIETAAAIGRRELTCDAVTRQCLERIEARDPVVRAWTHLDRSRALAQARALDAAAPPQRLHGVPVGVKDVFDTFDMPSAYGSPIYADHRPRSDAAVLALLRGMGGLVLGKTVTTEFATFTPNVTSNPHNPAHTPGGSSSGSAAAVADGMVPVAFGTQTIGSIIRPAAYCGVVGYKPSFGLLPRTGVKAISDCLDTVGCFTRSVADAAFFAGALARRPLAVPADVAAPRIGLCRTAQWAHAQPETQGLFEMLGAQLSGAGAAVSDYSLPPLYDGINAAQDTIAAVEMAACLAEEHRRFAHLMSERLRLRLDEGTAIAPDHYDAAMSLARQGRRAFADALAGFDVLVVPSAMGEAPRGLGATGDPVFNRTWSLLHTPCVHVPLTTGPNRLPLGVQVVGRIGDDAHTLACAHWIETRLREPAALPMA
jgi:amidase